MAKIIPSVTRLSKGIIRVLGFNPGVMTLQGTNTYLLGTGKSRILVDAGDKDVPEYEQCLKKLIKEENAKIEHIIVTHWHHDHIGGVENLYKSIADSCKVWKHKKSDDDAADNELPSTIPINWLSDGQELKVDGATVKIHHTPGHTTDHIVLTLLEDNSLLSGDCILGEGTAVFEDLYTYMQSLDKILNLKPSLIYPGHGNVVEEPEKQIQHYIAHRKAREDAIIKILKANPTSQYTELSLVKIIYTGTPSNLHAAAAYNVNHHLTKLKKEGKVEMIRGNDGLDKWKFKSDQLRASL